jgi:hypothetical protein
VELGSIGWVPKLIVRKKSLIGFWLHIRSEYSALSNEALKYILPFATTYEGEVGFSAFKIQNQKKRSRLDVESD